ncbi:restriction endonuclease subunit S [Vibrio parahaemolyticus]|nr:restriction endonuclease subunit S [Vibrio parahaemolyticus]
MPKYETYKDSKVLNIGLIPQHWNVKKLKFMTSVNSNSLSENSPSNMLLEYVDIGSVSFEYGIEKTESHIFKEAPSRARRLAQTGDVVVSTVRTYLKAIAYVDSEASKYVYSTGFAVISPKGNLSSDYLGYLVKSNSFTHQVDLVAKGMSYPAINTTELSNLYLLDVPESEQHLIAKFLNHKIANIDEAIIIKEQQINLLKERKQIVIQQAVTQGLDPNVSMKDSGVDWLGKIPKHWDVKRLKYVLEERSERSKTGEEPLLMMSQVHGLVVRSEYHEKAEVSASNIDNKIVYENDLVFNKLKPHLGVFFKSSIPFKGIVSPDYAVYRCKDHIKDAKYLEILFRHPSYIEQFIIRATGIVEGLIRLYTDDLFDMSVPVAPSEEQEKILNYIDIKGKELDQVISIQLMQIEKLKEYKTALIDRAVTGKIKITPEMVED